ncbi:FecR domain-containing protein [Candidatus Obscuribacterales bacterium]|nr:FecR domain-containing protein [Candidatus Obscuribacterales bacterium]
MRLHPLALSLITLCALQAPAAFAEGGTLTFAEGQVFKRGFSDDEHTQWAAPVPAAQGDFIDDGMQIGTGKDSFSEAKFDNITLRSAPNTVYTVSPKQNLIYVVGGKFLFNHDRKAGDSDYTIWTEHAQVVAKGTTLLFDQGINGTRVSVLEGVAEITNRLDQSVLRLTPGMSYVAADKRDKRDRGKQNDRAPHRARKTSSSTSSAIPDTGFLTGGLTQTDVLEALTRNGTCDVFGTVIGFQLLDLPGTVEAVGDLVEELPLFDSVDSVSLVNSLSGKTLETSLLNGFPVSLAKGDFVQKSLLKSLSGKGSVLKGLQIKQLPILSSYNLGGDVLDVAKIDPLDLVTWAPTSVLNSVTGNSSSTRNMAGVKKFHVKYGKKQTRLNATFINGAMGSVLSGNTASILGGKNSPISSVTSILGGGGRNAGLAGVTNVTNVLPAGLGSTVGGVVGGTVGGLTSGLTGRTVLGGVLGR